jgi:pSer/pThr/pTyr-binding forkhead associated (FHA) protein
MGLTVVIKPPASGSSPAGPDQPELRLTLDSPRVVIGRAKSCDVQLLDPSVSTRHASIRQQGGRNLIVDEGSTNGVMLGSVKLPAQTPRAVRDGEMVRIGRVWLELRFAAASGADAGTATPRTVALDHLRARLEAEGETLEPSLVVIEGPDEGERLTLSGAAERVVGRSRQADLPLSDELVSRRHLVVRRDGDGFRVCDLASKRGSRLESELVDERGLRWNDGEIVELGQTKLILRDPLAEAMQEVLDAPDARMRPAEYEQPPPGTKPAVKVVQAPAEGDMAPPDSDGGDEPSPFELLVARGAMEEVLTEPTGRGFGTVDVMVVLVALCLLAISLSGLYWVLG